MADLQHIGTWVKSYPKMYEGKQTMIVDGSTACQAQEECNAELYQAHYDQSGTLHMLERYLKQDEHEEQWKPGQIGRHRYLLLFHNRRNFEK